MHMCESLKTFCFSFAPLKHFGKLSASFENYFQVFLSGSKDDGQAARNGGAVLSLPEIPTRMQTAGPNLCCLPLSELGCG